MTAKFSFYPAKKFLAFFLLSFFLAAQGKGQTATFAPYTFPAKVPSRYVIDAPADYQKIIESFPADKKIKARDKRRYAESVSYQKRDMFSSGSVYIDWNEMENYLNSVLQKIIPESENNSDGHIRMYLARNAVYNAYAIHDGTLFFNVGLFADVINEAGLAIILGHEFGHYLHQDVRERFIKNLRMYTRRNRNRSGAFLLESAHRDRQQEAKADSTGYILADKAGYDLHYGVNNFYQFLEIEKEYEQKAEGGKKAKNARSKKEEKDKEAKNKLQNLLADHPETQERIDTLQFVIQKLQDGTQKKDFIVNENLFRRLQAQAKMETLHILLNQNHFTECAERAFAYYLLEPENEEYIYYLMESIRRLLYIDQQFKSKGFLTSEYGKYFKKGEGILHNLSFLIRDSSKFEKIAAKELADTAKIEFETYAQAFDYFSNIARQKSIKECYLSIALYHEKNAAYRDSLLQLYIGSGKVKYPEFASAFINKKLMDARGEKELILMDDITFLEDHFYGYHNRLILAEEKSPVFIDAIQQLIAKKFPDKELAVLSDMEQDDLRKAVEYRHALYSTTFFVKEKGGKLDLKKSSLELFILDPYYWYLFKNNDLKSLGFLKIQAFDDKTKMMGMVRLINPFYWFYFFFSDFSARFAKGSPRFLYVVNYYAYTPGGKKDKIFAYRDETNYVMNTAHLKNSMYYAFKYQKRRK